MSKYSALVIIECGPNYTAMKINPAAANPNGLTRFKCFLSGRAIRDVREHCEYYDILPLFQGTGY